MKSPTSQRVRSSGENRPRRLSATLLVVCFVVMFAVPLLTITAPHASAEPGWWNYNWTRRRPITITIPSWYSSSWPYRKQITIDHTKVENENFTNFPVLISITDTDLASKAQDDGDDILFTASNGTTKLPHEIENFHKASGTLVAWVRVPTLYDNENTYIYMYYGNATCSSQQNATGVWDGNFKGVWHLSDATTSLIDNFFEYGSEGVFNPAATAYETSSTVALDSRHALIAYRDSANSNYGTAVIATISGTGTAATVSFGSEYVFNDASTLDISAVALSETKVLIAYRDVGNSNKGTAIIATISGSTITHGSEYVFNDASTDFISATKTSENVLIAYRDVGNSNKGTAIMANISGNTITYGSEHVFNNGDAPQIHAGTLASDKALITFDNVLNSGRGTACVATVSGLTISFGASTVFESGSPNYTNLTVLGSSLAVTSYEIEDDDWEAYVRPLTISGTTVTAGTRSNIGVGHDEEGIAYGAGAAAALDSTHVVVIYRDNDNSGYGTTKIGTVSGTGASATVTFGPKKGFNQSSICAVSAARLDRIHALITYRDDANLYGTAIVATIHGYGTANDSTSNNNDGTIHRSLRALGKVGSGMNFDGGDNYINVPDTDSQIGRASCRERV